MIAAPRHDLHVPVSQHRSSQQVEVVLALPWLKDCSFSVGPVCDELKKLGYSRNMFESALSVFSFCLDWINQVYLRANHDRLKVAHTFVTDELKMLGVPFLNRNAGFFVWIDFRKVSGHLLYQAMFPLFCLTAARFP